MECFIRDVTDSDKSAILDFSRQHPWKPSYPTSLVNRFLTELISSNELIFDLHDAHGRAACGVLLDKVNNLANDACLEIIGLRHDTDPTSIIAKFVDFSRARCPSYRTGIQLAVPEASPTHHEILQKKGLVHHYSTYEMENSSIVEKLVAHIDQISLAKKCDSETVYNILCEAFRKNPDISIPEADTWHSTFLNSNRSHYYLWHESQQLVGYAHLSEPDDGESSEVRAIGVIPSHRGTGVGRELLQHCLNESIRLGYNRCHLTVAVENEKALGLYLRSGFKVIEKHTCFRMDLKREKSL